VRDGSRFVNIAEVHADGSLVGIHIFDFADVHTLRHFIRAGRAVRDGNQWTLADVQESLLHDDSATIRRVAQQPWDTSIDTGRLKALWMRPEDISARELYRTIGWLERYQQNPLRYELAFWRRITTPLYTVLMVMLAVPIVMMSSPRAPIGEHIVRGAAIGIGFQMAQQTFSNYGLVAGLPPLLTALAPAAMALAAIVMLFRLHVTE
jgi:lipopolysaccharide export system permease protein